MRKREEDAAQQKLEVEAAQKDLSVVFFFSGRCTVLEQSQTECESKTWRHIHMSKLS